MRCDYIAVFELVKNSFDAYATQVDIYFENIYSGNGKIVIQDNGKGMNYDDLLNKWLFVAYSAKYSQYIQQKETLLLNLVYYTFLHS